MFCRHCGKEINDNSIFCPYCGNETNGNSDHERVNFGYSAPVQRRMSTKVLVGFIVSLVGIFFAALPCGIVGLIFSVLGKKEGDRSNSLEQGLAIAGIIISIVDIFFGILAIIALITWTKVYLSLFSYL